jgi:hypothetical protein
MIVKTQMFPISSDGTVKRAGILMLPEDYDSNSQLCKLLIFNHGSGESGDGTLSTINALYSNGSPLYQVQQGALTTITSPLTGKPIRYAIFALQGINKWNVSAIDTMVAVQLLLTAFPKISPTGMFVTGLSSGGETAFEMVGGSNAGLFCGAFPLSCAPSVSDSVVNWGGVVAKVWAMHGSTDVGSITDKSNSVKAVNSINGAKKGYAYYSEFSGGHCCWAAEYAPTFKKVLPILVNNNPLTQAINAYEFWAACLDSTLSFTASGTDAGTGGTTNNTVATKAIFTATANGNTITLDGSASVGNGGIGSYIWNVSGPSKPAWPSGRNDGGGQPGITTLPNMVNGSYTVSLQVFDKVGGPGVSATQTVVVGGGVVTPPVVDAPKILAIVYNTKTGDRLTVTDDNKLQIN